MHENEMDERTCLLENGEQSTSKQTNEVHLKVDRTLGFFERKRRMKMLRKVSLFPCFAL